MLDLGIYVSSDCSFEFHITNLNKRTTHLTGWILRTFSSRDKLTRLTLFKALVMSRLDYGSQLWSPYLTKHINMIEKTQDISLVCKVCPIQRDLLFRSYILSSVEEGDTLLFMFGKF